MSRLSNRRFWRNSGLLMLANVIAIALGLVRTPAMTWLLPKQEVGMMGVITAWQTFLIFLTWPSSLNTAAYHYVAKGQPAAFTTMLAHQLRWSLLSVLGFWVSAAYWWWQGEEILAVLFVIGGLSYPMTVILAACASMLGAQEKFVALFWYRIGQNLANFSGFILLLLSVWWVSRIATFYAMNQLALGLIHIWLTVRLVQELRQSQTPPMPPAEKQEMMRYGKQLTGINSIGVVQSQIDLFLVSTFLPLETTADYSIALLFQAQLKRIWIIYVTTRYPPLVRLPIIQRRRRLLLEGTIVWVGFLGLGIILSIMAHWAIPILLPAEYASSLGYVNWVIATTVISIPGSLAEFLFRMEQNAKGQFMMRIVASALSLALPTLLIFNWGAYGAIFGRFVANFIFSLLGLWLVLKMRNTELMIAQRD